MTDATKVIVYPYESREHVIDRLQATNDELERVRSRLAAAERELEETRAAMRSDTGELWETECMNARQQRDEAQRKLAEALAMLDRLVASSIVNPEKVASIRGGK